MKFTAKLPEGNVNVSKTHPLTELLWMIGGLVLLTGTVFAVLGFSTDWAVSKTPVEVESWLGDLAIREFPAEESPALKNRLDALLARIPESSPLHRYNFSIYLSDSEEVNAVALPGGRIVVFRGLLDQIESENELAMVLAHELGHFAHRDHLRGLGRGLGLAVAAALLLGEDNSASSLVSKAVLTFQINYSQAQEAAADRFGVDLLTARYGHAGGATTFFARLAAKAGSKIPYVLASHPHPQDRIVALEQRIRTMAYPVEKTLERQQDLGPDN
jgi:predicted Zn-dependent protease